MGILKHHHLYIQYRNNELPSSASTVSSSTSYLVCRNIGFLCVIIKTQGSLSSQIWLSHRIIVVSIFRSKRPDISFRSHMASQLSRAICYVSAFVVLRETLDCFLLNHELIADPKQNHLPDVLFLSKILPAQSAFVFMVYIIV